MALNSRQLLLTMASLVGLLGAVTLLNSLSHTHESAEPAQWTVDRSSARSRVASETDQVEQPSRRSLPYSLYVSTDAAWYKPGNTVRVSAVFLTVDLKMVAQPSSNAMLTIRGPKGDIVFSSNMDRLENSVSAGTWQISPGTPGGEYIAEVSQPEAPKSIRRFEIRAGRAPRLRMQLTFENEGVGPGDSLTANLHVTRSSGEAATGAAPYATVRLDGATIVSSEALPLVDASGASSFRFTLPTQISAGVGQLSINVDDGSLSETIGKTLPILMQSVDVDVYPEGGDIVAGCAGRVYIEAKTPWGDPADISAGVFPVGSSARAIAVATVTTTHEGRGVSTPFTARSDTSYELRVSRPSGITTPVPLPAVRTTGICLTAKNGGVYNVGNPVSVHVAATPGHPTNTFRVALFRRDTELSSLIVSTSPSDPSVGVVQFAPPSTAAADGVLRVTVFDTVSGIPLAERLIYRRPTDNIRLEITPNKSFYQPGDEVELNIQAFDSHERPIPAVLALTVSDESVLQALPTRRQPPRLPAQVLLEHEVAHLDDSVAYPVLASSIHPSSHSAEADAPIDLLLGTQGWRRFAYSNFDAFFKSATADSSNAPSSPPDAAWSFSALTSSKAFDAQAFAARMTATGAPVIRFKKQKMRRFGGAPGMDEDFGMPVMAMAAMGAMEDGPVEIAAAGMPMRMAAPMAVPMAVPMDPVEVGAAPPRDGVPKFANEAAAQMAPVPEMADYAEPIEADVVLDAEAIEADVALDFGVDGLAEAVEVESVHDGDAVDGMDVEGRAPHPPMMPRAAHKMRPRFGGRGAQVVRVYAHKAPSNKNSVKATRSDFTDTVYWAAGLTTDAGGGAVVKFQLSDAVTSFRVAADAFADGMLGSHDAWLTSDLPINVEIKSPVQVTVGDHLTLPVGVVIPHIESDLKLDESAITSVSLSAVARGALSLEKGSDSERSWKQTGRATRVYMQANAITAGEGSLTVTARDHSTEDTDVMTSTLTVKPGGFPVPFHAGGMLKSGSDPVVQALTIPSSALPGSLNASILVYPTPVASLTQALEALIREPCGCFEQTSGTTYPLVMAQAYFKSHYGVDQSLIQRAAANLQKGYKKLIGFESKGGGFEWFGGSPAHEALTAYGALQFQDMAQVMNVDREMLSRTRAWLRSRADGKGGFSRSPQALDSFGRAPPEITNAYIVWSLVKAGETGLEQEVQALLDEAHTQQSEFKEDPYFLGLVASSLYAVGRTQEAKGLAQRLTQLQSKKDGSVPGAKTSITCSGGDSLMIEATSVSVLVWLDDMETFAPNARRAMDWLVSRCKNGRFGSTQATVLALKAIVAYDALTVRPNSKGTISLNVNGGTVETLAYGPHTTGALVFVSKRLVTALDAVSSETKQVELVMTGGSAKQAVAMPYSLEVVYNSMQPPSHDGVEVSLSTSLASSRLTQGDPTELTVRVVNRGDRDLPMLIAVVGLPAGLEPRHEKLRELVQANAIAFYELQAQELTLYWRGMGAGSTLQVPIDVVASVPGEYTGDASRAYLYYTDELKHWTAPLQVSIAPRAAV